MVERRLALLVGNVLGSILGIAILLGVAYGINQLAGNPACASLSLLCPPIPGAAELAPHVPDYLNIAGLKPAPDGTAVLRSGKLVAVDVDGSRLDDQLQRALPADLRAERPEEVGTIVWVKWWEENVGYYEDYLKRGEAYQGHCTVTVIDKASALILDTRIFDAAPPPATTTNLTEHTKVDVDEVVAYLKMLPAR